MATPRPSATPARPAVIAWLWLVAALTLVMVAVGGVTRLTESGLSITHWDLVSGTLPPMTDAAWQRQFTAYRQIDQYAAVHAGMTIAQFKGIFYWEWGHRLLGRFIGLVALFGWGWFALRRIIPAGFGWRLVVVPPLVGLQGAVGWLMVASGLVHGMTEVAPAMLAAHLLTALALLAYCVWTALDLSAGRARLTWLGAVTGAALALQLLYGALMAGLRAGHVTDQWPLMNGAFWPGPTQSGRGLWGDLTADPAVVHFIHRWWAWAVVVGLVLLARAARGRVRAASIAIHTAFGTQILLGIATVMAGVPLWLAALHQLVGASLVGATVWGAHVVGRAP